MYNKYVKRTIDVFLSLISIPVVVLIGIIIAIAIKIDSPGPIFFKQRRIGINKKSFYIIKFRTMRMDAPKNIPTEMLSNPDACITKVGKFLRKTSLDEIPQVFNILVGDMAIVGPRPALWNQYELIQCRDRYNIHSLRPGLTGWAQINGRDTLSTEKKVQLDNEYAENISFIFDTLCFIKTIFKVLRHEDVVEGRIETIEVQHNEVLYTDRRYHEFPTETLELVTESLTNEL